MLKIPAEKLPQEWSDEARLDALFSPFRSRTVNAKDWDTKMASWKNLISMYCAENSVYTLSLGLLRTLFVRHGRPPMCLDDIFEEMVKTRQLQPLEDFLKQCPQTWSDWAANLLVKQPVSWSLNTLKKSLFTAKIDSEQKYVYVDVVREEAEKLFQSVPEKCRNKVMNFAQFLKVVQKDAGNSSEVQLLVQYLVNRKKVHVKIVKEDMEGYLVKIGSGVVSPIGEVEIGVYILEENEKLFTKHVEDLEDEIGACVVEVKKHLLKGHRQLAKNCLRKKHEMERRLTRKIDALHNIQVLLEKIRDVHTDADVWQSYKHALTAFNTTFKDTGLNEDAVEDTMLKLTDMLDQHDDVTTAISRPIRDENEQDLEDELAELLQTNDKEENDQDVEEKLSNLNLDDLPVPSPGGPPQGSLSQLS